MDWGIPPALRESFSEALRRINTGSIRCSFQRLYRCECAAIKTPNCVPVHDDAAAFDDAQALMNRPNTAVAVSSFVFASSAVKTVTGRSTVDVIVDSQRSE